VNEPGIKAEAPRSSKPCDTIAAMWATNRQLRRRLARGLLLSCALAAPSVLAHGIAGDDQAFLLRASGAHVGPYMYLGAKHMVTGYDHLLFLAGVIFFLYRLRSEEHTSELQSRENLVCRLLLEKKKHNNRL